MQKLCILPTQCIYVLHMNLKITIISIYTTNRMVLVTKTIP
jgi:hypothetical protein